MMAVLLVAGIGSLLMGLLAIAFGIPVKEFSFGNTLILTGAIVACTGMVLLGLWVAVRELKQLARHFGAGGTRPGVAPRSAAPGRTQAPEGAGFPLSRDPATEDADDADLSSLPPWQEEAAARDRVRIDAPPEPEPVPAVKPRRNLLFSSSSRKERERAQARTSDSPIADLQPAPAAAPPASESSEPPPATFDDAWPKSERARTPDGTPPRRSGRAPSTFTEPTVAPGADRYPPALPNEDQPPVTVLKSGIVDGMAYSLYSDGSIEAQMPEGMMRFSSIDELRSHLDQRP
jgi:hypothetical protein